MARKGLTQTLHWLWQSPAELRWMDPLPLAHRRGLIAAVLLVLLAFLWPAQQESVPQPPQTQQPARQQTDVPLQATVSDQPPGQAQPQSPQQAPARPDAEGSWHNYKVENGQTLAQLFRNNNLQVNDVFAMARVEGDDKPLSNLQRGQTVKVRVDAQGVVTGLAIDGSNGPALFTRQPDGSFIRAQ